MRIFGSSRWLKKVKAIAMMSAVALSVPTAAIAQTSTDQSFEGDLYNFLQSENAIAHYMATNLEQQIGLSHAEIAQGLCYAMEGGESVQKLHADFLTGFQMQADNISAADYEELRYSAELYFGTVINLGAAYYCPSYHEGVIQALSAL